MEKVWSSKHDAAFTSSPPRDCYVRSFKKPMLLISHRHLSEGTGRLGSWTQRSELAENEGGIWLATESSLLKKMHLWIQPRQESLKNPDINTDQFTHKCKQVHKWKASCKFKFNSSYINVTTSKYILMKIANILWIHILMDLYYIYLKQDTFVCGSEMCLWNLFLFMDLFYIYT